MSSKFHLPESAFSNDFANNVVTYALSLLVLLAFLLVLLIYYLLVRWLYDILNIKGEFIFVFSLTINSSKTIINSVVVALLVAKTTLSCNNFAKTIVAKGFDIAVVWHIV